jgi:hypothetical protein
MRQFFVAYQEIDGRGNVRWVDAHDRIVRHYVISWSTPPHRTPDLDTGPAMAVPSCVMLMVRHSDGLALCRFPLDAFTIFVPLGFDLYSASPAMAEQSSEGTADMSFLRVLRVLRLMKLVSRHYVGPRLCGPLPRLRDHSCPL